MEWLGSKLRQWQRPLIFGGVVVLGVASAPYAFEWFKSSQLQAMRGRAEERRLKTHFESNQRACDTLILSVLPNLKKTLYPTCNVEALIAKLRTQLSAEEKAAGWEELKMISLTRTVSSIYALSLLLLLLRVQMNIIGRHQFVDRTEATETDDRESDDQRAQDTLSPFVQQRFMAAFEYFLSEGVQELCKRVRISVEHVVKDIPLKALVDFEKVTDIVSRIKKDFEGSNPTTTYQDLTKLLLPPETHDRNNEYSTDIQAAQDTIGLEASAQLAMVMDETRDILESQDFTDTVSAAVNSSFLVLYDRIQVVMNPAGALASIHFVKSLPVVSKEADRIFVRDRNDYIDAIISLKVVDALSALVYSISAGGFK